MSSFLISQKKIQNMDNHCKYYHNNNAIDWTAMLSVVRKSFSRILFARARPFALQIEKQTEEPFKQLKLI